LKRSWWGALVGAAALLLPSTAPLVAAPNWRRGQLATLVPWTVAGLAPLLGLALLRALLWPAAGGARELLGQGLLICLGGLLLVTTPRSLRAGLLIALALIVAAGWVARLESQHSWRGYAPELARLKQLEVAHGFSAVSEVKGRANAFAAYRLWALPAESSNLLVTLELRPTGGEFGWGWAWDPNRVTAPYRLARLHDDGGAFTRADSPTGPDPYLYRSYQLGQPLAGMTLRAALTLRLAEEAPAEQTPACGTLQLAEEGGRHVGAQTFCLDAAWQRVELNWQPPASASRPELVLVINDLDGRRFDIGEVSLSALGPEGWRDLSGAAPTGLALRLSVPGVAAQTVRLSPQPGWTQYRLAIQGITLAEATTARLELQVEDGSTVETRRVRVEDGRGQSLRPLPSLSRQGLWYGHPNLLGHSVAAAGLTVLSGFPAPPLAAASAALTLVALSFSGSRLALAAFAMGILLIVAAHVRGTSLRLALAAATVLALAASVAIGTRAFDRSLTTEATVILTRQEVWSVALSAWLEHPWTGIGPHRFADYWRANYLGESAEIVNHANNLWLHFAASYGLHGLLASLWLTVALLWLAWRWGRWRGLALLLPIFAMNVFDYTLFYPGVLYPLLLGLNALRRGPPADLERPLDGQPQSGDNEETRPDRLPARPIP
jgi:hypothetical protein